MPWTTFKLGRPGFEYDFEEPPEGMSIDEGPIDVVQRNLAGDLKKSLLKVSAPTIRINSSFLQKTQRDQFASLAQIKDSFLSFKTRDDWQVILEKDFPTSTSTLILENSSATRLSAALVAVSMPGTITINGVFTNADGSGTNYFSGGSYADATRIVTLGTALSSATNPVYVTYTYSGWLVNMRRLVHNVRGGWVDRFTYDFQLDGA